MKVKLKSLISDRNFLLVFFILVASLLMRAYMPLALFQYGHDQDLSAWFIADFIGKGDIRLIGQETSTKGVFIGPLYYYLLTPFFLLFNMDPKGGLLLSVVVGVLATYSYFWVFRKMFGFRAGIIAAIIHAFSFLIVTTEREVVPTMPVFLWSVWFLYDIYLFIEGKQKNAFLLSGILVGLTWHLNLALVIGVPLLLIAFLFSRKKVDIKYASNGILIAFMLLLPLFVFEFRNDFLQTRAILGALNKEQIVEFSAEGSKLDRVFTLMAKNVQALLWGDTSIPARTAFHLLLISLGVLCIIKKLKFSFAFVMSLWIFLYIAFFTKNGIILSEYYLHGITAVWVLVVVLLFDTAISSNRILGYSLLLMFVFWNVHRFVSIDVNRSGYIERRAIVSEIKKDAQIHGYPCIAISYITKPGLDFGYRYFFRLEEMHVNHPNSNAPVYTIVFPHSMVDSIDKSFGALGLLYPDYDRYNKEGITESCSGENSNLTDSIFGLSK